MRFCFDLDSTLVHPNEAGQVDPIPAAVELVRQLSRSGHTIIITTRPSVSGALSRGGHRLGTGGASGASLAITARLAQSWKVHIWSAQAVAWRWEAARIGPLQSKAMIPFSC